MKTYKRRVFAFVLAIAMILPLLPGDFVAPFLMEANAATEKTIASQGDFKYAMENYNSNSYVLVQTESFDIDWPDQTTDSDNNGKSDNAWILDTTYNGNGYTITVNKTSTAMIAKSGISGGLFSEITASGKVMNLGVAINITDFRGSSNKVSGGKYRGGKDYFGGIAGKNSGTIENCSVTGTIKMTQFIEDQSFSSGNTDAGWNHYYGYDDMSCESIVGGIAGVTTGGIYGCYSSVKIYLGSNSKETFYCKWTRSGATDKSWDFYSTYMLRAGGIVGMIDTNGKVESNLSENVYLYLGNTGRDNYSLQSNKYTTSYGGGIAGHISGNIGTVSVKSNAVRSSGIYAPSSKGYAGFVAGRQSDTGDSTSVRGNNYYNTVTAGAYSGAGLFDGSGYSQNNGCVSTSATPNTSYWQSSVMNGQSDTPTSLSPSGTLKWRTISAPSVSSYVITPNGLTTAGFTITIAPPAQPETNPRTDIPFGSIAGMDWDWANAADNIRYVLKVTGQSTLGAPTARLLPGSSTVTLLSPEVGSDTTVWWRKKGIGDYDDSYMIPLTEQVTGASQEFEIMVTDDNGIKKDSIPVTIKADKAVGTKGTLATPTVTWPDTDSVPSLGYSGIGLTYPTVGTAATSADYTFQYSTDGTTYTTGTSKEIIEIVEGYYKENKATVYVKTVASDGNKYNNSSPIKIDITRTIVDDVYEYTATNTIETAGHGETAPVYTYTLSGSTNGGGAKPGSEKTYKYTDTTGKIHSVVDGELVLTASGIDIAPKSTVELKLWMYAPRVLVNTENLTAAGATAKPIISPGTDGSLKGGVTITAQEGAKIYYTLDGENPTTESAEYPSGGLPWSLLNTAFADKPTLMVKAIAQLPNSASYVGTGDEFAVSAVTEITYGVNNKPGGNPPFMTFPNGRFNTATYYNPGDAVHFGHDENFEEADIAAGAEIWYTYDGSTPERGKVGAPYDSQNPFQLPSDGRNSVLIQAYLYRPNFPPSEMLSQTVNIKSQHGAPLFSLANNAKISIGQTLSFQLYPNDLPPEIRPTYYMMEGDDTTTYQADAVRNSPGEYYGVLEIDASSDFSYSIYAGSIPTLTYTINGNTRDYNFGMPEIRYMSGGIEVEERRENHVPGTRIELSGDAGKQVEITAQLKTRNIDRYTDGATITQVFTFQNAVATPKASPGTTDENLTTMNAGQTISLSSMTSGAQIFYSLKGMPLIMWSESKAQYVPARFDPTRLEENNGYVEDDGLQPMDSSGGPILDKEGKPYPAVPQTTFAYDSINGIPVSGTPGSYFVVYAGAVKSDMSPSEIGVFTYRVANLNAVAAPTATPTTSVDNVATVENNSSLVLVSATSGAKIFYSTAGVPSVTNGAPTPGTGTEEYSITQGIPVQGNPGSVFTVYAVAVKEGMADSEVVTLTYKIAELPLAATPTATPKTEDGSPVTLQSGSVVTLQTETSGASIYYSLTGTPTVTKSGTTYTPGEETLLFDKSITVSGNAGEFFVIRALTVKDGYRDSEIATFNYQLPAPVQAVYTTPGEGTVVKDTEVILATTTEGATIYYETAKREEDLEYPIPDESLVYTKPLKIEEITYISAMAVKDGVESIVTQYEFRVASQVEAPVPSIPSGSVVAKGTKVSFTTSDGASITYTKDGSDPTDEKSTTRMHGADIAIDAEEGKSVSISVYAHKTGMTPSEVVSVSYTVSKSDEVMTANPPGGSIVKPGDRITLTTSVTDAVIHYTTDGSEPTRDSESGSTVLVDGAYGEAFILRAIAVTESTVSTPFVFNYSIIPNTPAPSASIPDGAVILEGAEVTLTAPEGNIYFTTDGSDPTQGSQMYTAPLKLTGSIVLKAIALADGKAESEVAEYIYTMAGQVAAPTASLPSGTIDVGSEISLSTTTVGATIYYTTNGTAPTVDNLRDCFAYESPIAISRPVSIRMFAVMQGMNPSVVNTFTYTVAYPEPEVEEEEEEVVVQHDTDRLFLFDQFVNSGEGPLFEDIVLRDSPTLAVVSAAGNALPAGVQLMVERERTFSVEDADAIMQSLEMQLCALYDITIVDQNGSPVQPLTADGVEIGVPIPEGYDDTIVLLCRINENGTVTSFPTRRSAGMLYAVVDHFSKYAVAVPPPLEEAQSAFQMWYLWLLAAVVAVAGIVVLIVVTTKKRKAN
jgi:hypothetical protein